MRLIPRNRSTEVGVVHLGIGTIMLDFHSFGKVPLMRIALKISFRPVNSGSPPHFRNSTGIPSLPAAFPVFNFPMAPLISFVSIGQWPGTHCLRMRVISRYILRKKKRALTLPTWNRMRKIILTKNTDCFLR